MRRALIHTIALMALLPGVALADNGDPDKVLAVQNDIVQQQPDPKKKEITASVERSVKNETLTLNAIFPEEATNVKVSLFNILGKQIDTHPVTVVDKGEHPFRFVTRGLPSGPYIVVLESRGQRIVHKVMVSR